MPAFADPIARRHLQRLMTTARLRDPQVLERLLADVADRIGGQAAILTALEDLAARDRSRRALRVLSR
jgi:hypothetical protein